MRSYYKFLNLNTKNLKILNILQSFKNKNNANLLKLDLKQKKIISMIKILVS